MPQTRHISDNPLLGAIESTNKQSLTAGLYVSADFTSESNILAQIEVNKANLHVSQRPLAIPAKRGIELAGDICTAGVLTGSDATDINDDIEGDWREGFPVSL